MPSIGAKLTALLATGRVANIPTVWSNVLVAFSLSLYLEILPAPIRDASYPQIETTALFLGFIIASFLYVGGCMLGDYQDISFDEKHRPDRPIPQGVLPGALVLITSVLLITTALILVVITPAVSAIIGFEANVDILKVIPLQGYLTSFEPTQILLAVVLSTLIITYACTHKKNRLWALCNMASCRTALIFFAITLTSTPLIHHEVSPTLHTAYLASPFLAVALAVGAYTFLLSSVASTESSPEKFSHRKRLCLAMITLPFLVAVVILKPESPNDALPFIFFYGLYLAWMTYSMAVLTNSKPAFVSNALAGFCLLDACVAATFSLPIAFICLGLFGTALLLQKVTPAT